MLLWSTLSMEWLRELLQGVSVKCPKSAPRNHPRKTDIESAVPDLTVSTISTLYCIDLGSLACAKHSNSVAGMQLTLKLRMETAHSTTIFTASISVPAWSENQYRSHAACLKSEPNRCKAKVSWQCMQRSAKLSKSRICTAASRMWALKSVRACSWKCTHAFVLLREKSGCCYKTLFPYLTVQGLSSDGIQTEFWNWTICCVLKNKTNHCTLKWATSL